MTRLRVGFGVRVSAGFKDSVGVQSGQNFPLCAFGAHGAPGTHDPWRPSTPKGGTFGNKVLAEGPLMGWGVSWCPKDLRSYTPQGCRQVASQYGLAAAFAV